MVTDNTQLQIVHGSFSTLLFYKNKHKKRHRHVHGPRLAELIQTAGLLPGLPRPMLVAVACCPKGTSLSFCLQGLTGPRSPGGRCSSPAMPRHHLPSAALLMTLCPAELSDSLCTTDGFHRNSLQLEEVVLRFGKLQQNICGDCVDVCMHGEV